MSIQEQKITQEAIAANGVQRQAERSPRPHPG